MEELAVDYDNKFVFALLDREKVKLLVVVTSVKVKVVVVLVSEEEFKPVKTYLKREEGLENVEFLYYASDADYKLGLFPFFFFFFIKMLLYVLFLYVVNLFV